MWSLSVKTSVPPKTNQSNSATFENHVGQKEKWPRKDEKAQKSPPSSPSSGWKRRRFGLRGTRRGRRGDDLRGQEEVDLEQEGRSFFATSNEVSEWRKQDFIGSHEYFTASSNTAQSIWRRTEQSRFNGWPRSERFCILNRDFCCNLDSFRVKFHFCHPGLG